MSDDPESSLETADRVREPVREAVLLRSGRGHV